MWHITFIQQTQSSLLLGGPSNTSLTQSAYRVQQGRPRALGVWSYQQRGKECTENVDAVFQLFSQYLSELIYGVLCRTRKKKQEVFLLFWLPASTEKVNLFSFPKHYKSGRIQNLTSFLLLYIAMDWTWAVAAQALQWRFSKRPVAKRLSAAVVLHCSLPQYCWSNRFCSYTGLRLTRGCHARLHLYRQGIYRHLIPKRKTKEQAKRQPSK